MTVFANEYHFFMAKNKETLTCNSKEAHPKEKAPFHIVGRSFLLKKGGGNTGRHNWRGKREILIRSSKTSKSFSTEGQIQIKKGDFIDFAEQRQPCLQWKKERIQQKREIRR